MNDFINNGWVISLASIVITFIVSPLLLNASYRAQSLNGALTGTYTALTQSENSSNLVAERVECRNVNQKLKGKIVAKALLELGAGGRIVDSSPQDTTRTFSFDGRVRARQVLLSYWSDGRTSQSGGTMTMGLDVRGLIFRGFWCGPTEDAQLASGHCMWIKDPKNSLTKEMDFHQFGRHVDALLEQVENPWRKNPPSKPISTRHV